MHVWQGIVLRKKREKTDEGCHRRKEGYTRRFRAEIIRVRDFDGIADL